MTSPATAYPESSARAFAYQKLLPFRIFNTFPHPSHTLYALSHFTETTQHTQSSSFALVHFSTAVIHSCSPPSFPRTLILVKVVGKLEVGDALLQAKLTNYQPATSWYQLHCRIKIRYWIIDKVIPAKYEALPTWLGTLTDWPTDRPTQQVVHQYRSRLMPERCGIRILTGTPAILAGLFNGFSLSLQKNSGSLPPQWHWFFTKPCQFNHSPVIPILDAILVWSDSVII